MDGRADGGTNQQLRRRTVSTGRNYQRKKIYEDVRGADTAATPKATPKATVAFFVLNYTITQLFTVTQFHNNDNLTT